MSDPFVAEIRIFPFNFAPKSWAFCNGQILPLSQNTALFSLLGTTYGGNGTSNFALPDLQGRAAMHPGEGPGLSLHDLGEAAGSETVTLLETEIPLHSHPFNLVGATATSTNPANSYFSNSPQTNASVYTPSISNLKSGSTLSTAGGDQPHNNLQPYLTLNFCIALQGVFPPRS